MTSTNTTVSVLSAREALAFATGKAKIGTALYGRAVATVAAQDMSTALVAYGISTRGLTTVAAGTASLTQFAKDTLRDGQKIEARRSALSKLASTIGRLVTAGVEMTPDTFEAVRIAGDSTADGRKILDAAVKRAAANDDKSAALVDLLDAAGKARQSKADARKASDAGKSETAAETAANGKASAPETVALNWSQTLAMLAATAPAETAALDADTLRLATDLVASIADALADATATVTAALATAQSKRK